MTFCIQSYPMIIACVVLSTISYRLGFYGAKVRAQRWLDQAIKNGTIKIQRR